MMREKRKEKREKRGKKREGRRKRLGLRWSKGRCDFSSSSNSSSDLQVESRERSQGKPRTSKFLMVGKLNFYIFHT